MSRAERNPPRLRRLTGLPDNEDSADVQDIIESTPELDMDVIGYKPCRFFASVALHYFEAVFFFFFLSTL